MVYRFFCDAAGARQSGLRKQKGKRSLRYAEAASQVMTIRAICISDECVFVADFHKPEF